MLSPTIGIRIVSHERGDSSVRVEGHAGDFYLEVRAVGAGTYKLPTPA